MSTTAEPTTTTEDFKVADLSLAEFGRKEIRLAEHEMPGLMATREEYAGQRLFAGVLLAQRHEARHLLLGEAQLLAAEIGERQVSYFERFAACGLRGSKRMKSGGCGSHAVVVSFPDVRVGPTPRACAVAASRLSC